MIPVLSICLNHSGLEIVQMTIPGKSFLFENCDTQSDVRSLRFKFRTSVLSTFSVGYTYFTNLLVVWSWPCYLMPGLLVFSSVKWDQWKHWSHQTDVCQRGQHRIGPVCRVWWPRVSIRLQVIQIRSKLPTWPWAINWHLRLSFFIYKMGM